MPDYEEVYNRHGIILVRGNSQDYLSSLSDSEVTLVLSDPPY